MKYLFSRSGLQSLRELCSKCTLFAFDFDGTLVKITEHPDDVAMTSSVEKLFTELNRRAPVAVITGRAKRDIETLLPVRPRYLIGNHGLEGARGDRSLSRVRKLTRSWKKKLDAILPEREGVEVEDKSYSLSVHYRRAANHKKAKAEIVDAVTKLRPGPRVILGKCVVNLVPPRAPHKGTAVRDLMARIGAGSALFVGDDETDEDVFSLRDGRILSVRVGRRSASSAAYFVKSQAEVARLLRFILSRLSGSVESRK